MDYYISYALYDLELGSDLLFNEMIKSDAPIGPDLFKDIKLRLAKKHDLDSTVISIEKQITIINIINC